MFLQRVGIPIYLQVKNFILEKIKSGEYKPGDKLPTERELSAELGISRNTVSAAYKELLLEGILEARQGRGTFVRAAETQSDDFDVIAGSRRERLLRIIDDAMAKVLDLGFTVEQFAAFVAIRAKEKAEAVRQLRVAVVECTVEFTRRFIRQIDQVANVHFETVLLDELESGKVPVQLLHACDLVVTTMEHQAVVSKLMGPSPKLIAAATVPSLEAVIRLARLPAGSIIGVIALTDRFVEALKRLLVRVNITGVDLDVTLSGDRDELRRFIATHRVLLVCEEREHLVRHLAMDSQEIIVFYYEIDQGSLHQIVAKLVAQTL